MSNNECTEILKKKLETLKQEKERRAYKNKKGLGYSVVPPPPAQIYSSPKKDLSWTGLPEFADDTVTDYSRPAPTAESSPDDAQTENLLACVNCGHFDHLAYDCGLGVKKGRTCPTYTHKSMPPRPATHKSYRPPMRPMRPNMNVAQPKRTSFHKLTHSYNKRPFQETTQDLVIILIQKVKRLERELKPRTLIHKVDRGRSRPVMAWVPKKVKAELQKPSDLLQQPEILVWKWERITMDFVSGFPRAPSGNDTIWLRFIMDDPNITIEEYIRHQEEKALWHGRSFNWQTATYVSTLNENEIDLRISFGESDDEDYMVIFDNNSFSYKIISVDNLKMDSKNDSDKVDRHSFPSPESTRLETIFGRSVNWVHVLDFVRLIVEMRQTLANRMSDTKIGLDVADTLCFQLGGDAPEKVIGINLFYLRSMDHGTINVPYLLAQYLVRHAEGRKSEARLSWGHFIGHLATYFGLSAAVAGALEDIEEAYNQIEGDQAILALVQAPPAAQPRTMPHRI
nr:putative reverse transcriptase domain-containing protein [Tanacetum cinerariifolium]